MLERGPKRLAKKAKRGFRGYPVATVALYGPDDVTATKIAVGIVPAEGAETSELRRWLSNGAVLNRSAIFGHPSHGFRVGNLAPSSLPTASVPIEAAMAALSKRGLKAGSGSMRPVKVRPSHAYTNSPLGSVVQIAALPMLDTGQDLALRGSAAPELVGHDHPRNVLQALEQLAEEPFGRPCQLR